MRFLLLMARVCRVAIEIRFTTLSVYDQRTNAGPCLRMNIWRTGTL